MEIADLTLENVVHGQILWFPKQPRLALYPKSDHMILVLGLQKVQDGRGSTEKAIRKLISKSPSGPTVLACMITSKTPRSSGRSKHLPLRTGFAFDGNLKDYGPELELTSNTGKPIKSAFTCPSFVQLDPFTVRFSLLRNLKNTFDSSSLTLDNLEEMKTRIIKLEEGSFDTVLKTGKKIAGRNWEKIERACGLNGIEKTGWTNLSLAHTRVEMNVSPISTIIFRNSFSDRSMRNSRPTTSNGNYDDDMPSLRPVSSARSWADIARGSPGSPSSHR